MHFDAPQDLEKVGRKKPIIINKYFDKKNWGLVNWGIGELMSRTRYTNPNFNELF